MSKPRPKGPSKAKAAKSEYLQRPRGLRFILPNLTAAEKGYDHSGGTVSILTAVRRYCGSNVDGNPFSIFMARVT